MDGFSLGKFFRQASGAAARYPQGAWLENDWKHLVQKNSKRPQEVRSTEEEKKVVKTVTNNEKKDAKKEDEKKEKKEKARWRKIRKIQL